MPQHCDRTSWLRDTSARIDQRRQSRLEFPGALRTRAVRSSFGLSSVRGERSMGGRIWMVTNGAPDAPALAFFSDRARAAAYRDVLVERYAMGRNLSLHGQPIADDAGTWQLGLGPAVLERAVD